MLSKRNMHLFKIICQRSHLLFNNMFRIIPHTKPQIPAPSAVSEGGNDDMLSSRPAVLKHGGSRGQRES